MVPNSNIIDICCPLTARECEPSAASCVQVETPQPIYHVDWFGSGLTPVVSRSSRKVSRPSVILYCNLGQITVNPIIVVKNEKVNPRKSYCVCETCLTFKRSALNAEPLPCLLTNKNMIYVTQHILL